MGSTGSAEGSQLHQKVQKRDAIHQCWKGMNLLTRMGWQRPQAFSREENMALPVINAKTTALLWVQGVSFTVSHTNIEIKPILEHSQQEEHGQVCKCAPPLSRAGNTSFQCLYQQVRTSIEVSGLSAVQCCSSSRGSCASGEVQEGKEIPPTPCLSHIPTCEAGWCSFHFSFSVMSQWDVSQEHQSDLQIELHFQMSHRTWEPVLIGNANH